MGQHQKSSNSIYIHKQTAIDNVSAMPSRELTRWTALVEFSDQGRGDGEVIAPAKRGSDGEDLQLALLTGHSTQNAASCGRGRRGG